MNHSPLIFSKAISFVEFDNSGNPQEKYKAGNGLLSAFNSEATKTGAYLSYMDQILLETEARLSELEKEIESYQQATFTLSLEHTDPNAYIKMRILESFED